jgi:hypothetical protein
MRYFGTRGLILLGTVAWLASAAHAQSNPDSSSLFPLSLAAAPSGVQPAGFCYKPNDASTAISDNGPTPAAPQQPAPAGNPGEISSVPFCQECEVGPDPYRGKWYGMALALAMTRNRAPATWTTTAANDPFDLRMNTQNAGADWSGGGQITIGYAWRGCGGAAVAFTYWGLTPMSGSASVSDATGNPATALSSTIFFGNTINGQPGSFYFDNAQTQAVWRNDQVQNLELNVQSGTYEIGSLQLAGLAGFRFFRFTESLIFGSASFGNSFASNGGADAAYLNFHCQNDLFGGQVGAVLSSVMTNRFTVFATPKIAVMGNQMTNLQQIYSGANVNNPDSYFHTHKSDVSVLSELDAGFAWDCNANVQIVCGYRLVSVTNLSLGDNQFGAYNFVEQSGSLILHGAFFGFTWIL